MDNFNTYGIGQLGVLDREAGAAFVLYPPAQQPVRRALHALRNEAGALLNVGFAFGRLDEYLIEQHANGGDVTVVKWFDQTGAGRHAQSRLQRP